MSELFMCAKTGEPCPLQPYCEVVNAPLVGAVTEVTRLAPGPGRNPRYAAAVLKSELASLGTGVNADFQPTADEEDATVCARDVLTRELPVGTRIVPTKEQIALGLSRIVGNAINNAVQNIRATTNNRRRRQ